MPSTRRSLPSQLQMVPAPVHVSPLPTSHRCCPVAGAPARDGTDMWKRPAAAQLLQLSGLHCLLDTGDHRALPKSARKFQTGGHSWLCLCSLGDPSFFPNTLPSQTGNRLPLDTEHFRAYQHSSSRNYNWNLFPPLANIILRL